MRHFFVLAFLLFIALVVGAAAWSVLTFVLAVAFWLGKVLITVAIAAGVFFFLYGVVSRKMLGENSRTRLP
ncbi:MAG TPA: hypothetical protein VNK96_05360 [Fimbriimonadales bacterium]|nr:hypothetical protein [Fimbriimonadales bacterium]